MRLLLATVAVVVFVAGLLTYARRPIDVVCLHDRRPCNHDTQTEHNGTQWTYTAPPEWVTTTSPRWGNN